MGGELVSVPVTWFNLEGGWREGFDNPAITFVVATVYCSNTTTFMHEMCVLGTRPNDNFNLDHDMFLENRKLWEQHGERTDPMYEYGKVGFNMDNEKVCPFDEAIKPKKTGLFSTLPAPLWGSFSTYLSVYILMCFICVASCVQPTRQELCKKRTRFGILTGSWSCFLVLYQREKT